MSDAKVQVEAENQRWTNGTNVELSAPVDFSKYARENRWKEKAIHKRCGGGCEGLVVDD